MGMFSVSAESNFTNSSWKIITPRGKREFFLRLASVTKQNWLNSLVFLSCKFMGENQLDREAERDNTLSNDVREGRKLANTYGTNVRRDRLHIYLWRDLVPQVGRDNPFVKNRNALETIGWKHLRLQTIPSPVVTFLGAARKVGCRIRAATRYAAFLPAWVPVCY